MILQQLRKKVPSLENLVSLTLNACIDFLVLMCVVWNFFSLLIYYNGLQKCKLHKHVTLTILHKLEIIRRHESGESCNVIMVSYSIGLSFIFNLLKPSSFFPYHKV